MPLFEGVACHVTTEVNEQTEFRPLREWGIQYLKGSKRVSCYIEAETDMRFGIEVQPRIPYIAQDLETSRGTAQSVTRMSVEGKSKYHEDDSVRATGRDDFKIGESSNASQSLGTKLGSHSDNNLATSKVIGEHGIAARASSEAPPFHLLVSVYIDGCPISERKTLLYLDPNNPDFRQPYGKVTIKERWVKSTDGSVMEQIWKFQDLGMDTIMSKLAIKADDGFSSPFPPQRGQIVVLIDRVLVTKNYTDNKFIKLREPYAELSVTGEMDQGIAHTAIRENTKTIEKTAVHRVGYKPFAKGEGPLFIFQFMYRSADVLAKLGLGSKRTTLSPLLARRRFDISHEIPLHLLKVSRPLPSLLAESSTGAVAVSPETRKTTGSVTFGSTGNEIIPERESSQESQQRDKSKGKRRMIDDLPDHSLPTLPIRAPQVSRGLPYLVPRSRGVGLGLNHTALAPSSLPYGSPSCRSAKVPKITLTRPTSSAASSEVEKPEHPSTPRLSATAFHHFPGARSENEEGSDSDVSDADLTLVPSDSAEENETMGDRGEDAALSRATAKLVLVKRGREDEGSTITGARQGLWGAASLDGDESKRVKR